MKGFLIDEQMCITYVDYDTPKDVYHNMNYTTCGACIEQDLVLVHPTISNVRMNPKMIFKDFIYDEPMYSPVLVMKTDKNGNPIDIPLNFFL